MTHGETDRLSLYGVFAPTLLGDINNDGTLDIYNALLLAKAFGFSPGSPEWDPAQTPIETTPSTSTTQ